MVPWRARCYRRAAGRRQGDRDAVFFGPGSTGRHTLRRCPSPARQVRHAEGRRMGIHSSACSCRAAAWARRKRTRRLPRARSRLRRVRNPTHDRHIGTRPTLAAGLVSIVFERSCSRLATCWHLSGQIAPQAPRRWSEQAPLRHPPSSCNSCADRPEPSATPRPYYLDRAENDRYGFSVDLRSCSKSLAHHL